MSKNPKEPSGARLMKNKKPKKKVVSKNNGSDYNNLVTFTMKEQRNKDQEWSTKLPKPAAMYRLEYEDDIVEVWGVWRTKWIFETMRMANGYWDPRRVWQITDDQIDAYIKARAKHG